MLNENVKKLLKENMWDLATCAAGVPNVVPVAFKDVTRCAVRARFCTLASRARQWYAVGRKQLKGAIFYAHCSPL